MHKYGMMGMLPADFWTHRRAAKRERLLSWHSLLDAAIARLDETTPADAVSTAGMLPPEFMSHRKAAYREDLLAFRSLLDAAIGRLDKPAVSEQATRIDIA